MNGLKSVNPAVAFIYFIMANIIAMFNINPVTALISLFGSGLLWFVRDGKKDGKIHLLTLAVILGCAIINPLFSHNGKTVIMVINNNPVAFESFIFGLTTGVIAASVFYWFSTFSVIMTSDKIIYTVGKISPKAALILTMSLRFVPLFIDRAKTINNAQKAMGIYREETIISRFKGTARVISAMVTYAVENMIVTAESMEARGYTGSKRRPYSLFKFLPRDYIILAVTVLFSSVIIYIQAAGFIDFWFYPEITGLNTGAAAVLGYCLYFILCLIPTLIEGGDRIRWRFLKSKISVSHTRA
jgi:energy-coupling factor transport system permease protein